MELEHPNHLDYQKLYDAKEKQDAIKFYRELDHMLDKWIREYRNKMN